MSVAEHDPFEERFADALRDAGTTFDTDRQALAARGEARGRRLRARRRAAVTGGAAGVALVGLGGVLVLPGGHGGHVARQPSAAGSRGARTVAPEASAPTWSGDELVGTLEKHLPKGTFSDADGRGVDDQGPYAHVVFDDGHGKAAVELSLERLPAGSEQARQATQCPDRVYIAYQSCTTSELPDHSTLTILKGYEYPEQPKGTKRWAADLVTAKGQHVSVQEWNAPAEKDAPVSRAEPPLSAAQLKSLVTADEWRGAVDAMPAGPPQAAVPVTPPGTGKGTIPATLARLLPHGLKVVAKSTEDDAQFGYVVVDDGRGTSLVQVNVQPDMQKEKGQLFGAGATTLPDGTEVVTHRTSGDKDIAGIEMWTVDTMRPDGRRVVISAFNSGAQNTPPTRGTPALTLAQLQKIATDPSWLNG